jgi:hypothetical protein
MKIKSRSIFYKVFDFFLDLQFQRFWVYMDWTSKKCHFLFLVCLSQYNVHKIYFFVLSMAKNKA